MTTHELARILLDMPIMPVVAYDTEKQVWREIHRVDDFMTHKFQDSGDNTIGPTHCQPLSMLPIRERQTPGVIVNEKLLAAIGKFDHHVKMATSVFHELTGVPINKAHLQGSRSRTRRKELGVIKCPACKKRILGPKGELCPNCGEE